MQIATHKVISPATKRAGEDFNTLEFLLYSYEKKKSIIILTLPFSFSLKKEKALLILL